VDGSGSTWANGSGLIVGRYGAGTLGVTNGGAVSSTSGYVGLLSDSTGVVTVDGAGSRWTSSASVYVGGGSTGAGGAGVVNISNGGLVQVAGTLKVWGTGEVNVSNGRLSVGQLDLEDGMALAMDNGVLAHPLQQLDLQGISITGSGEIVVGSAGVSLGVAGNEGSLVGTSDTERLVVYGDVGGWGSMSNVTIYGNLSVGSSPGSIDAAGLTLTSSGTLTMELGGLTAGAEYDQIEVTGALALDGALEVIWYGGFEAVEGDTFTLFDLSDPSADVIGTFDPVTLPAFTDTDLAWNIDNLYTTGEITVIPEPVTMTLLALGGLAVLRRRRVRL